MGAQRNEEFPPVVDPLLLHHYFVDVQQCVNDDDGKELQTVSADSSCNCPYSCSFFVLMLLHFFDRVHSTVEVAVPVVVDRSV